MKIGITAEIFPPAWEGGRSLRIYETAKAMALFGHEVHVYCHKFKKAPSYEVMEGVNVHRIGLNVPSITSYYRRMVSSFLFLQLLFKEKHDVLNTNTLFPPLSTSFVSKCKHTPIVFTTDGLLLPRLKKLSLSKKGWLTREFTIWLEKFISKIDYDAIIAVSNYVKQEMIDLGVSEDKLHVVYSGVDLAKYDAVKAPEKEDESIVYIGNLLPHKGVSDLICALKSVKQNFPNALLNIIGSGPMFDTLKMQTNELGLEDNVVFYGRVPDLTKMKLLKASRCLVLPSIMESFGLVFLEAMACEKPVIAYDIPAARETISDGYNGFLVPQKDVNYLSSKISDILSNKSKAKKMGRNGRKLVKERFTWKKTAEKTLAVYKKALN